MFQSQDGTFRLLLRCAVIFLQRRPAGTAEVQQSLIVLLHPAPSPLTPTSFLSEEPGEVHFCSPRLLFLESATLGSNAAAVGSEARRKVRRLLLCLSHSGAHTPSKTTKPLLSPDTHPLTLVQHSCCTAVGGASREEGVNLVQCVSGAFRSHASPVSSPSFPRKCGPQIPKWRI